MLTTTGIPNKMFLFAGIISAIYFGVLFSNLLKGIDFVLIGVVVEMFTIPMILAQFCIAGYILYLVLFRRQRPSIEIVFAFLVAIVVAAATVISFTGR